MYTKCLFLTHLIKFVFKVDSLTDVTIFFQILSNSLNRCKHPMVFSHFQNLYIVTYTKVKDGGESVVKA